MGPKRDSEFSQFCKRNKKTLIGAGVVGGAVTTGIAAVVAAPIIIGAVGFGAGGVVAGSIAAGIQSWIGSVAAGSLFASLQSAGVLGLAASTNAIIGVGVGGVVAAGAGVTALVVLRSDQKCQGTQTNLVRSEYYEEIETDEDDPMLPIHPTAVKLVTRGAQTTLHSPLVM